MVEKLQSKVIRVQSSRSITQTRVRALAALCLGVWLAIPSLTVVTHSPVARYTLRQNSMMVRFLGRPAAEVISSLGLASAITVFASLIVFPLWLWALTVIFKEVESKNTLLMAPTLLMMSLAYACGSQLPGLVLSAVRDRALTQLGLRLIVLGVVSLWMVTSTVAVTVLAAWPKYRWVRACLAAMAVWIFAIPNPAASNPLLARLQNQNLSVLLGGNMEIRIATGLSSFVLIGFCLLPSWFLLRRTRHGTRAISNA